MPDIKQKKQRDARLDLLRCMMMLGVCLLHSLNQYDADHWRYGSMWYWCVDGFVFISGWFGISFRLSKIVRLYSVAIWCAFVVRIVGGAQYGVVNTIQSYWFLHAYVFMMLLAPVIDSAIEYASTQGKMFFAATFMPFLLLVFGWSYLANFDLFKIVPHTPGLGASTGLSLLGIYAMARICKKTNAFLSLHVSNLFLSCSVLVIFALGVFNCNLINSPTTLLLTTLIFVASLKFPMMHGRLWRVLAPSMFSVYLLHTNGFVFGKIRYCVDGLVETGCPRFAAFILLAIAIFLVCIGVDMLRRSVLRVFARVVDAVCAKIDSLYDTVISKILSVPLFDTGK